MNIRLLESTASPVTCETGQTLTLERVEQVDARSAVQASVSVTNVHVCVAVQAAPACLTTTQISTDLKIITCSCTNRIFCTTENH